MSQYGNYNPNNSLFKETSSKKKERKSLRFCLILLWFLALVYAISMLLSSCSKCETCTTYISYKTPSGEILGTDQIEQMVCDRKEKKYMGGNVKKYTTNGGTILVNEHTSCK